MYGYVLVYTLSFRFLLNKVREKISTLLTRNLSGSLKGSHFIYRLRILWLVPSGAWVQETESETPSIKMGVV